MTCVQAMLGVTLLVVLIWTIIIKLIITLLTVMNIVIKIVNKRILVFHCVCLVYFFCQYSLFALKIRLKITI